VNPTPASSKTRQDARLLRLHIVPSGRLDELGGELETLAQSLNAPFTATKAWLNATWSGVQPEETWAVIVRDHNGTLCAGVVVLDRLQGDRHVVTLADAHLGFRGSILATDDRSAALLAYGLRRQLQYRDKPTVALLGPVASDTIGLAEFSRNLGNAELATVDPIPLVVRSESPVAGDYLSSSMRRTLRKATNRLATDGRTPLVEFTGSPDTIRRVLPALHQLHVERDHSRGIASTIDTTTDSAIWKNRIVAMAERGVLELDTLHIDGGLASYVLTVRAGAILNVLEGVLDPEWGRYAPGRLLETALLQRMLDDPTLTTLDWTSPVAPESLLAANGSTPTSVLSFAVLPALSPAPTARSAPAARNVPEPRAPHEVSVPLGIH
jgi:CelD/BcsL family acetyltransferase involved in cellulose biosynthesis